MTKEIKLTDSGSLNIKFGHPENKSIVDHVTRNTNGIVNNTGKHHNHINNSNINYKDSPLNYYWNMTTSSTAVGNSDGNFKKYHKLIHKLDKKQYSNLIASKNYKAKTRGQKSRMTDLHEYVTTGARKKRVSYGVIEFGSGFDQKITNLVKVAHPNLEHNKKGRAKRHRMVKNVEVKALRRYCHLFNKRNKYIKMVAYGINVDENRLHDGQPHAHVAFYNNGHTKKGKPSPTFNNAVECDTNMRSPKVALRHFYKKQMVQMHKDFDYTFNREFHGYHLVTHYHRTHSKVTGLNMHRYKKLMDRDKRNFKVQRDSLSAKLSHYNKLVNNNWSTYHSLRSTNNNYHAKIHNYKYRSIPSLSNKYHRQSLAQSKALSSVANASYTSMTNERRSYQDSIADTISSANQSLASRSSQVAKLMTSASNEYSSASNQFQIGSDYKSTYYSKSQAIEPTISSNASVTKSNSSVADSNSQVASKVSDRSNKLQRERSRWNAALKYKKQQSRNINDTLGQQDLRVSLNQLVIRQQRKTYHNYISSNKVLAKRHERIHARCGIGNNRLSRIHSRIHAGHKIVSYLQSKAHTLKHTCHELASDINHGYNYIDNKLGHLVSKVSNTISNKISNYRSNVDSYASVGNTKAINSLQQSVDNSTVQSQSSINSNVSHSANSVGTSIRNEILGSIKNDFVMSNHANSFVATKHLNSSESSSVRPSSASSSQSSNQPKVSHISKIARKSSSNSSTFGSQYHHNGPEID